VNRIGGAVLFALADVGNEDYVARRQNIGVLALVLQFRVLRVIPEAFREETVLKGDARDAVAWRDVVLFGQCMFSSRSTLYVLSRRSFGR
jgi:hypothetical protein